MDSNDRVRILNAGNLSTLPKSGFETMKPEGKHDRSSLLRFILTRGSEGSYNSFMIYSFLYLQSGLFLQEYCTSLGVRLRWAPADVLLKTEHE